MNFGNISHIRLLIYLLIADVAIILFTISSAEDVKIYYKEFQIVTLISFLKLLVISWLNWNIFKSSGGNPKKIDFKQSSTLWLIIAAGFLFLSLDEIFLIHENTDKVIHAIFGIKETGITDRLDDLIVFIYGILGIGILYSYREEIYRFKKAIPYLFLGFAMLFFRIIIDTITNRNDIVPLFFSNNSFITLLNDVLAVSEGTTKLLAETFFIAAFYYCYQKVKNNTVVRGS